MKCKIKAHVSKFKIKFISNKKVYWVNSVSLTFSILKHIVGLYKWRMGATKITELFTRFLNICWQIQLIGCKSLKYTLDLSFKKTK